MSKLAHSNEATMQEIEQRSMFSPESDLSKAEAFEILEAAGVYDLPWDKALDAEFSRWQYFNRK